MDITKFIKTNWKIITLIVFVIVFLIYLFKPNQQKTKVCYVQYDSMGNEILNSLSTFCLPMKYNNNLFQLPMKKETQVIKFKYFELPSCKYRVYLSNKCVAGHSSPPIHAYGLLINEPYKLTIPGQFYISLTSLTK